MFDEHQREASEMLLRDHDPDRWLACRFIPEAHRDAVIVLYAFSAEVSRIRSLVSEPLAGEMRLQYWRDVLNDPHAKQANPLAAALLLVLARYHLPTEPLLALIDARIDDLYDEPPLDVTALELYCGETCSVLFRYASLILADGGETGPAAVAGTAGVAYGLAGLMRASGYLASTGRLVIPQSLMDRDQLKADDLRAGLNSEKAKTAIITLLDLAEQRYRETNAAMSDVPKAIRPAYAPLALVPYWIKTTRAVNPLRQLPDDQAQWRKTITLWRAAAFGI